MKSSGVHLFGSSLKYYTNENIYSIVKIKNVLKHDFYVLKYKRPIHQNKTMYKLDYFVEY